MIDGYDLVVREDLADGSAGGTAAAEVRALVERARSTDGVEALNEAALLNLRRPHPAVRHLLVRPQAQPAELAAYAQLEQADSSTGQLLVAPGHRRRGIGSTLLRRLIAESTHPLQVWAMGDTEAARAVAARVGLVPRRTLLIMRRPLDGPVPQPPLSPGVRIRAFVPGQDDADWLAVNARAFASHPEQGAITAADLQARMAEPWFDPAGFLVAERDGEGGRMLGFHWTKQHTTPDPQLGEVYVLGVDPEAGGRGLGKALLAAGLAHLQHAGSTSVELYVEADQAGPVGLYRSSGFVVASRDVMYGQP